MTDGPETTPGTVTDTPRPEPPTPLEHPADGVPDVVETEAAYLQALEAMRNGTGPVAVDAERASGYRYGQRAYLVQLRRSGAGTWLIDPIACPDLHELSDVLSGTEWVLHAASQDLPCLAEIGMRPTRLFDTELGARLAGLAKVGLASVVEDLLGLGLAKEHSAVDWSTRPLPEPWLRYAALDVEVLVPLRDAVHGLLVRQGKLAWAEQEFAALANFQPAPPRVDPWRRTSGMHRVRNRRQLAAVRELWQAREQLAQRRDTSPGRILPDAAIVAAATAPVASVEQMLALPGFRGGPARRAARTWWQALQTAGKLPDAALPLQSLPSDSPPPARSWPDKDPAAAARLTAARADLAQLAQSLAMPVENIVSPDSVRRILWSPPGDDLQTLAQTLRELGAREWQVELAAPILTRSLAADVAPATQGVAVVTGE
ncbi:MAG: HRDC domain-containing protein [Actinomycetales bacterium]